MNHTSCSHSLPRNRHYLSLISNLHTCGNSKSAYNASDIGKAHISSLEYNSRGDVNDDSAAAQRSLSPFARRRIRTRWTIESSKAGNPPNPPHRKGLAPSGGQPCLQPLSRSIRLSLASWTPIEQPDSPALPLSCRQEKGSSGNRTREGRKPTTPPRRKGLAPSRGQPCLQPSSGPINITHQISKHWHKGGKRLG